MSEPGIEQATLYALLGIKADAREDEIEAAYRAAVLRLKPNVDAGEQDALMELRLFREAHHILMDPERRARYDAWMRPLADPAAVEADERPNVDGLGMSIIVTLIMIAIGAGLAIYMLFERAEDVRIEHADIVREKASNTKQVHEGPSPPVENALPAPKQRQ